MELDINEIQKILPHRPPMLLVDRIIELEPFKSATGIKNVTMNEPHFLGHFPGHPIMPLFGGMEHVKFKRQVVPGAQLVTKAQLVRTRGDFGLLHCDGYVDGELAASADFKFALKKGVDL